MRIYDYEAAFGASDKTSKAMRKALEKWMELYYQQNADSDRDPCQRIGYTVVNKLVKAIFGEYNAMTEDPVVQRLLDKLNAVRKEAVQLALVEGECYIKPYVERDGLSFMKVPRSNVLVFSRDAQGEPLDVGMVEKSTWGKYYYTLLERRRVDEDGYLSITNQLFRSGNAQNLGVQVELSEHPLYGELPRVFYFPKPMHNIGLVRMKTPMLNCVDGSHDGVSVYAAAVGLIENIDRNEAQMNGEFRRGQSRIVVSADMLRTDEWGAKTLADDLFVGLDEDPDNVGVHIFSPQLREQAYLARKQEYLRNVESIVGLQRGMLSDVNMDDRTATEITASAGDLNLTVIDFQEMWLRAVEKTVVLCQALAQIYHMEAIENTAVSIDWGNGVLYDEDKKWEQYQQMVDKGLLKPEIALGWRFNVPAKTPREQAAIRENWMPETNS